MGWIDYHLESRAISPCQSYDMNVKSRGGPSHLVYCYAVVCLCTISVERCYDGSTGKIDIGKRGTLGLRAESSIPDVRPCGLVLYHNVCGLSIAVSTVALVDGVERHR